MDESYVAHRPYIEALLGGSLRLECRSIELRPSGEDAAPVACGPGVITGGGSGPFRFELHNQLASMRPRPAGPAGAADEAGNLRVRASTYQGEEWNGLWASPALPDTSRSAQVLVRGEFTRLARADRPSPISRAGTLCVFIGMPELPYPVATDDTVDVSKGRVMSRWTADRKTLDVEGSAVEFRKLEFPSVVQVSARTSERFDTARTDGWISEALQYVTGRPVQPRIVVRSRTRSEHLVLIAASDAIGPAGLPPPVANWSRAPGPFWELLTQYLRYCTRSDPGSTPLARIVGQLIAAGAGARDAFALSLAVAVEGLSRHIDPDAGVRAATAEELAELRKHIEKWTGDARLRARATGLVELLRIVPQAKLLAALERDGWIEQAHVDAWDRVRNMLAHGGLLSEVEETEEIDVTQALVGLFHRLAFAVIGYEGAASDYLRPGTAVNEWRRRPAPAAAVRPALRDSKNLRRPGGRAGGGAAP